MRLMRQARWLSTSQIHRRFFAHATVDAVRKRLHKLTEAGYVRCVRAHPMAENLFALGPAGKRLLEQQGSEEIILESRLPKQIEHHSAINGLRISAELGASLSYFFACWELANVGWKEEIIPDAIFAVGDQAFAAEVDLGQETLSYFVRTKVKAYERGFDESRSRYYGASDRGRSGGPDESAGTSAQSDEATPPGVHHSQVDTRAQH
jgi:hypothetical protein